MQRARKASIAKFHAESLDGNEAMLGVFRDSGFPMTTAYSWGVIDVDLDIADAQAPGKGRSGPDPATH